MTDHFTKLVTSISHKAAVGMGQVVLQNTAIHHMRLHHTRIVRLVKRLPIHGYRNLYPHPGEVSELIDRDDLLAALQQMKRGRRWVK